MKTYAYAVSLLAILTPALIQANTVIEFNSSASLSDHFTPAGANLNFWSYS